MSALAAAAGRIMSHVVAPTAFVFLLLVAMLVTAGLSWPWEPKGEARVLPHLPALSRLFRHLLATAAMGYGILLAIVAVFHVLIGGGSPSIIGAAASGGAFLAFGVVVPLYLGLAALIGRR